MMEMGDKERAFKEALARFCELASPDSKVARDFVEGYNVLRNHPLAKGERVSENVVLAPSQCVQVDRTALFNGNTRPPYLMAAVLYYLCDAVALYERRNDEGRGQMATLFDPRCQHIKSLRHAIGVLTESQIAFPPESKEFKAAMAISGALDAAQENRYAPPSAEKIDPDNLLVTGYDADAYVSDWRFPKGKGIVAKTYNGPPPFIVCDMGSETLVPQLVEFNVLLALRKGLTENPIDLDINVIAQNGDMTRFNYFHTPSRAANAYSDRGALRAMGNRLHEVSDGNGADIHLSAKDIAETEETVLPYLAATHPPFFDRWQQGARKGL